MDRYGIDTWARIIIIFLVGRKFGRTIYLSGVAFVLRRTHPALAPMNYVCQQHQHVREFNEKFFLVKLFMRLAIFEHVFNKTPIPHTHTHSDFPHNFRPNTSRRALWAAAIC